MTRLQIDGEDNDPRGEPSVCRTLRHEICMSEDCNLSQSVSCDKVKVFENEGQRQADIEDAI